MILTVLLFIVGLALLIKGADYFVEGGGGLAARYGVPSAVIGFTIIAFGTSLPEFVVSINAIVTDNPDVALGNILGSNIANIALVLALCAMISPAVIARAEGEKSKVYTETMLMLAATAVFAVVCLDNMVGLVDGIILLIAFVIILYIIYKRIGKEPGTKIEIHGNLDWGYTVGGLVAVIIGSQFVLDSAVTIATALGIPAFVIGMSMVAVGTSLPELATSLVAILKGDAGISAGNLLGSNIFNLLMVLGTGALIRPLAIPHFSDIVILVLFSLAVIPLVKGSPKVTRIWGGVLLAGYIAYMVFLYTGI
ncbi:conjugal transfer protein TraR [Methanomicrobiaceae archaeon CYW5]|uniref:calcium/sodium antiporter n=1 Tax=Methanovulcanius yangii TaxID=1789227 RepID=UPI0029CA656C|nr:calcium/sodium antiporter [Methanovulcanius yangii]MBT8508044.1 conjugal transfer protein TraR [Methanovulcanius yangii]